MNKMDIIELATRVLEVRVAQKNYFRERTQYNLEVSKKLERELDETISEIINPKVKNQTSLF